MHTKYKLFYFFIMVLLLPNVLLAHTGVGHTSGFLHGFFHPFEGVDHLLAMLAVGLWSSQLGGKASWIVPLSFVSVLILGGVIALLGANIFFVKIGILLSLVILGVLIATSIKMPLTISVGIVGAFALFHGHSHGSEMLSAGSSFTYGVGFLTATVLLHMIGFVIGYSFKKWESEMVVRVAGAFVALFGIGLFAF